MWKFNRKSRKVCKFIIIIIIIILLLLFYYFIIIILLLLLFYYFIIIIIIIIYGHKECVHTNMHAHRMINRPVAFDYVHILRYPKICLI